MVRVLLTIYSKIKKTNLQEKIRKKLYKIFLFIDIIFKETYNANYR